MPKSKILQDDLAYNFQSYFEMPHEPEEILAELGCSLTLTELSLPKTQRAIPCLEDLRQRIRSILPLVSLTSETARREALIAPILMEVARNCNCPLKMEYPLHVNPWLNGHVDYLMRSEKSLLVVSAQKHDLTRGFTQLAVELIALSKVQEQALLYGAVTIGNVWQFGIMHTPDRRIIQDMHLYAVPDQIEDLAGILVGILEP